tara:strand:- start:543 stop:1466 length:924 start_codon:yes stop_codon:yes gene_type:complete
MASSKKKVPKSRKHSKTRRLQHKRSSHRSKKKNSKTKLLNLRSSKNLKVVNLKSKKKPIRSTLQFKSLSNLNRLNKNNKSYKSNNKINIIFDLDETLVHSKSIKTPPNGEKYLNNIENQNQDLAFLKVSPTTHFMVHKRPYYKELLDYCYKHHNVSFWTAGTPNYCMGILDKILTPHQLKKAKIIFARHKPNETYNCNNSELYRHKTVDGSYPKLLPILWKHPKYKRKFNKKNTVLFDNSEFHTSRYPKNTVNVPDFSPNNQNEIQNDRYLLDVLNSLKKLEKHNIKGQKNNLSMKDQVIRIPIYIG